MIIFDARKVRANEARPLFYVALGKILFFGGGDEDDRQ